MTFFFLAKKACVGFLGSAMWLGTPYLHSVQLLHIKYTMPQWGLLFFYLFFDWTPKGDVETVRGRERGVGFGFRSQLQVVARDRSA